MKRLVTSRMTGILLLLAILFFVLEIFTPVFTGDGTFALFEPVQSKYEAVQRLNVIETAIYSVYVLGMAMTAWHMLRGFEGSRMHAVFKVGTLLMLAAWILGIYRMYCIYGGLPGFGQRISNGMYIGTALLLLLLIDMLTGHRLYPVNTYVLIILAVFFIMVPPVMALEGAFSKYAGNDYAHWALVWTPLCVHSALLCMGFFGFIKLTKEQKRRNQNDN